jgi:8-oxo-dGTP diphosphatase
LGTDRYRGKLRIRSCGLLIENDQILLVKLLSPVSGKPVWLPPGGGVTVGESLESAVEREFYEETGLQIETQGLKIVHELIKPPFHSIEMYFYCRSTGGTLQLGRDPEFRKAEQILIDLKFIPVRDLGRYDMYPEIIRNEINGIVNGNLNVLHSKTVIPEGE